MYQWDSLKKIIHIVFVFVCHQGDSRAMLHDIVT